MMERGVLVWGKVEAGLSKKVQDGTSRRGNVFARDSLNKI